MLYGYRFEPVDQAFPLHIIQIRVHRNRAAFFRKRKIRFQLELSGIMMILEGVDVQAGIDTACYRFPFIFTQKGSAASAYCLPFN